MKGQENTLFPLIPFFSTKSVVQNKCNLNKFFFFNNTKQCVLLSVIGELYVQCLMNTKLSQSYIL